MRCYLCGSSVIGADPITVPKFGPAHRDCYETKKAMEHDFQGLIISNLTDAELTNLKDIVLVEENRRNPDSDDDVELF